MMIIVIKQTFNIQGCRTCDYGKYSNEANKNSCNDCQININGQK